MPPLFDQKERRIEMSTRSKLWKRIGSTLLAMAILLSLLPVSVMAAGATIQIYHSLYEYNPQTHEYVAPSYSSYQESKALSRGISAYIGSANEPCSENTYQIKIPSAGLSLHTLMRIPSIHGYASAILQSALMNQVICLGICGQRRSCETDTGKQ